VFVVLAAMLAACAAQAPAQPYVPGHFGPNGFWIPGHYR
jgi:hypothetical protein